jgi:hypothetical protein
MKINFDGELPELQNGPSTANGTKNGTVIGGPSTKKK